MVDQATLEFASRMATSLCPAIACLIFTKALTMKILTSTARVELSTLAAMRAPCSLKAFGKFLARQGALEVLEAILERLETADVPAPFRGAAIALVTAGLMSMAFMGFSGLTRG